MSIFEPATLSTTRLQLSPVDGRDAPAIRQLFVDDPRVTRYVAWRPLVDQAQAQRFVDREERAWNDEEDCRAWLARETTSGAAIASVAARHKDHTVEFSYVVAREFWGKGFATEIARAVIERGRLDASVVEVRAVVDVENVASCRVLEKAGMAKRATLPKHQKHNVSEMPRDCFLYALQLRRESSEAEPTPVDS